MRLRTVFESMIISSLILTLPTYAVVTRDLSISVNPPTTHRILPELTGFSYLHSLASNLQQYDQLSSRISRTRGIRFDESTLVDTSNGNGIRYH